MKQKFKLPLLSLLLLLFGTTFTFAQSTFSGNVSGRLIWNDPQGNTIPLENIRMQLIANGHGVVAQTASTSDGLFDFTVPAFTDPNSSLELKVKVWAANGDNSIQAKQIASSTTTRRTTLFNNGQLTWAASNATLAIGDAEVPTSLRAQCVHWANKAKSYVESELVGEFTFPTGPAYRLHIMEAPILTETNFFLPKGLVATVIGLLAGPVPTGAPAFVPSIAAAPSSFSNNPGLYILNETSNGTLYHEFGHHLMWMLQNESWLSLFEAGLSFHSSSANDPSQKMAWTEGFADGFSQIMVALDRQFDGTNIISLDNPSNFHLFTNSMKDINGTIFPSTQVLDHGFAGEAYIGDFIYDLWDGPGNLALMGNSTPSTASFSDSGEDNTELSLSQILGPLLEKQAPIGPGVNVLSRFGQDAHLINNVVEYHDLLLPWAMCFDGHNINHLTRINRLHNLATGITDPLAQTEFINSDHIYYNRTVATRRFKFVGKPTFNFKELNPPDAVDYKLDVTALRDSDDDYNMMQDPGSADAQIISDDIQVSLDPISPATLHINRHLSDRFQSSSNTWGEAAGVKTPQSNSDLSVWVHCNTTVDVGDQGTLELGDDQEGNTAEVRFWENSTFQLGGPAGSGRGPGKLIIHDGSRLVIGGESTFIFNSGSEIILDGPDAVLEINGNWIIENGATFTFSGEGHIQTRMYQPIVMGPNSSIDIDGLGKQEHLIWVALEDVDIPKGLDQANFSLKDGMVELGQDVSMLIHDSKLTLEDLIVGPNVSNVKHNGIYCDGNINRIERVDFKFGFLGLEANMLGSFAKPMTILTDCKFLDLETALKTTGKGVLVGGSEFTNNQTGWMGAGINDPSGFTDCLFGANGAGVSIVRPAGPTPINIGFLNSSMNGGYLGIQMDGAFNLTAQCLNITNATTAVVMKNSATATLNNNNNSSFVTSGSTWILNNGRLPDLAGGNNQYYSGGFLFEGSVMPSPSAPNWNTNHWQATDNASLAIADQNMVDANTGAVVTMLGSGMSGYTICGAAPKNGAASAQSLGESLDSQMELVAFPQPFTDRLSLQLSGIQYPTVAQLQLLDLNGKVQVERSISLENGNISLDGLATVPAGIYFLRIQSETLNTSLKVIKQ